VSLLTDNQQPRDASTSTPLSPFQQTQLEEDETFYATFPAARLAKLAEEHYLMHGAVAFHYDIQPEPVQYHGDSSGTGYIDNGYIPVGNTLPLPRPPDPSNNYIHNPSDFLHFDYGPNSTVSTSMFQSFPPIPNAIPENGPSINVAHGTHYNSIVSRILSFYTTISNPCPGP